MAQHDYVIANQSGAAFRSDLNNGLSAIVTQNSGGSAPSPTYAYMTWADTTTGTLKQRNGANNAWQIVGDLNGNVLVLDTNRNVGIGTATPSDYNASYDNLVVFQASGNTGITIASSTSAVGGIAFADGTSGDAEFRGYINYDHSLDRMQIGVQGGLRVQFGGAGTTFINSGDGTPATMRTTQSAGTSFLISEGYHSSSADLSGGTSCYKLFTNGNIQNTNNSYGSISDAKLKENIADAGSQWSDIKALQVRNYNLKQGQTHRQIGVIAQELELVSPGLVTESPDIDSNGTDLGTTTKSVNYSVLYMKAVKALQEAMERIETLEAKMVALEEVEGG
jgi:hypothetical protein